MKKRPREKDAAKTADAQELRAEPAPPSGDGQREGKPAAPQSPGVTEPPPPASSRAAGSTEPESSENLVRSTKVIAVLTVLSRLTGLWRFRLMAQIFGASGVADAFNFAFIFPNLTRRLFGEGAMTSAFVPVFSSRLAKDERDAANRTASVLLSRLSYWLSLGCIAVIALSFAFRRLFPALVADYALNLQLFEFMLPYLVFINIGAVLMGILNSMRHFAMPAFSPVILNVLMILACYYRSYFGVKDVEQIWGVAYAVLLGGVLQAAVQVPVALAKGFRFTPTADRTDPGYAEVMSGFKSMVLLVAIFQINVMMDNIIALKLVPGNGPVTYLNMGTSVYQLPWSIFSLALGTAALPLLSRLWAQERKRDFVKSLLDALRMSLYLAIPCTVGIMLLSEDIVRLLYGTGRFLENDAEPVRRTAGVVMYSSLGLVFFSVNSLLARALYAVKDMRTPTTTSAWSAGINLLLNLALVLGTDMKESGIALASTLSNAWQTWMLARAVMHHVGRVSAEKPDSAEVAWQPVSWRKFLRYVGLTAVIAAAAAYRVYQLPSLRPEQETLFAFLAAAAVAVIPLWLAGRTYFIEELVSRGHKIHIDSDGTRYGVPDKEWPELLKFQYSIYSTVMSSIVLGFFVWAVRDSIPPEGKNFFMALQRAVAPIVAGMIGYAMASGGWMSREYDELKIKWTFPYFVAACALALALAKHFG